MTANMSNIVQSCIYFSWKLALNWKIKACFVETILFTLLPNPICNKNIFDLLKKSAFEIKNM